MYETVVSGKRYTTGYRIYIRQNGQLISPFHDIPLYANKEQMIMNMVVEIPRWTNAKLEIATGEKMNPLKQDVKKGKLRFVRNCFPYKGYIWNYGALPQTWEDPTHVSPDTMAKGDNDPIDVCEIGEQVGYPGQVKQVKILGVMALLDEGETDWKLIAIDVNDPMASVVNDIDDVKTHFPELIRATHHWFKIYKMPDGKPANHFAFDGQCKDKAYAHAVIQETHDAWKRLIEGKIPCKAPTHDIDVTNITVDNSPYKAHVKLHQPLEAKSDHIDEPGRIDGKDNKWYHIKAQL